MSDPTRTADGRVVLRTERLLNHSQERVWDAIIDPAQLSRWYPFAVVALDPRVGGRISFDDGEGTIYDGEVKQVDPPVVFSFTEADDLLHIELRAEGERCRVILTHTFDDPSLSESNAQGWEECLDDLETLIVE